MKRLLSLTVLVLLVTAMSAAPKVEVYYFHYTRRCATCQAVEAESQKALASLYANEIKDGKVEFVSVNLDDKESDLLAKKYKPDGQSLLVIGGAKQINLTDKAFLYARSKPASLKAALKKAVDSFLK